MTARISGVTDTLPPNTPLMKKWPAIILILVMMMIIIIIETSKSMVCSRSSLFSVLWLWLIILLLRICILLVFHCKNHVKSDYFPNCLIFVKISIAFIVVLTIIIDQNHHPSAKSWMVEAIETIGHQQRDHLHQIDDHLRSQGSLPTKATRQLASSSSSSSTPFIQPNYIEYNLADYCTEETWSDYPGRHLIRLEKSLRIRLPSILDFQFNETHRNRFGFFHPGPYPVWSKANGVSDSSNFTPQARPSFVPYCLLSFSVDYGHRIYAEGLASGLITEGKEWFTETLHFKTTSSNTMVNGGNHKKKDDISQSSRQPQLGTFTTSTEKNSLTLVFEQLHLGPFSFHLILTPFRDAKSEHVFGCESPHEYQCTNQRCIARYLTCDHHNNCGDYSDEHVNCMARVPTSASTDGSSDYPPRSDLDADGAYPTEVPIFPVDPVDGWGRPRGEYEEPEEEKVAEGEGEDIPEYVDVPFPTDGTRRRPSFTRPKPMNGFHGAGAGVGHTGGGFLGDLFRFDAETSNVVKLVRYLLALLVIIILVTLINFLIWCLITKRDQWFMATEEIQDDNDGQRPPTASASQPSLSIISV